MSFRTGHVDTCLLPREERAEIWGRVAAPGFSVSNLPSDVRASGWLVQMGAIAFTESLHPRQTFERDASQVRRDGVDAFFCSIELDMGTRVFVDGLATSRDETQVSFVDLARPVTKVGAAGRTLCMQIDRDALRAFLGVPEMITRAPLSGALVFLADYLQLIQRRREEITPATAPHYERAFLELVAACAADPEAIERSRPTRDELLRDRALVLMDHHLSDPDLGPSSIAAQLRVSRSTLYRVFEATGGVQAALRERRLQRAREALRQGGLAVRVKAIAYDSGFRSDAQFSHAFRHRFGETPGDVRAGNGLAKVR